MKINFYGYACGLAGPNDLTKHGPITIKNSKFSSEINFDYDWQEIIASKELKVAISKLFHTVSNSNDKFCVFGGDHSSAIASVQAAKTKHQNLKLIWVDAHMDLHNLTSSHSKNIHGMSLATLLGHADQELKELQQAKLTLAPENVCIFGTRSFEAEEQQLLEKIGVNVIYMHDIKNTTEAWQQALCSINLQPDDKLMFSIDLDVFDPKVAPAVTVPEASGLNANAFCQTLIDSKQSWQQQLIGCEIVEFAPANDIDNKTEQLIFKLLNALFT